MARITAPRVAQGLGPFDGNLVRHDLAADGGSGLLAALPEFRAFQCFIALAQSGNLARATRMLQMDQSVLTRHVSRLEQRLKTRLFTRHSRGVTLTSTGIQLFNRLDGIMHMLTMVPEQESLAHSDPATVAIALPSEAAPLIAPTLFEQLRTTWPEIKIEMRDGVSASLEEWVLNGQVDLGILCNAPSHEALQIQPIVREGLGLVIGPRSPLADSGGPMRLRDLVNLPLILTSQRHSYRRIVASVGFKYGLSLRPILESDSIALIKALVNRGVGHSILPAMAAWDEISRGALLYRRIEQPTLSLTYSIALRRSDAPSTVLECARILQGVMTSPDITAKWSNTETV